MANSTVGEILFTDESMRDAVRWEHLTDAAKRFIQMENRTEYEIELGRELCIWFNTELDNGEVFAQHQFGPYFVDFMVYAGWGRVFRCVVVEVDGAYHDTRWQRLRDVARTEYLEKQGCRVLRFTNEQVETQSDCICVAVKYAAKEQQEEAMKAYRAAGNPPIERPRPNTEPIVSDEFDQRVKQEMGDN